MFRVYILSYPERGKIFSDILSRAYIIRLSFDWLMFIYLNIFFIYVFWNQNITGCCSWGGKQFMCLSCRMGFVLRKKPSLSLSLYIRNVSAFYYLGNVSHHRLTPTKTFLTSYCLISLPPLVPVSDYHLNRTLLILRSTHKWHRFPLPTSSVPNPWLTPWSRNLHSCPLIVLAPTVSLVLPVPA